MSAFTRDYLLTFSFYSLYLKYSLLKFQLSLRSLIIATSNYEIAMTSCAFNPEASCYKALYLIANDQLSEACDEIDCMLKHLEDAYIKLQEDYVSTYGITDEIERKIRKAEICEEKMYLLRSSVELLKIKRGMLFQIDSSKSDKGNKGNKGNKGDKGNEDGKTSDVPGKKEDVDNSNVMGKNLVDDLLNKVKMIHEHKEANVKDKEKDTDEHTDPVTVTIVKNGEWKLKE